MMANPVARRARHATDPDELRSPDTARGYRVVGRDGMPSEGVPPTPRRFLPDRVRERACRDPGAVFRGTDTRRSAPKRRASCLEPRESAAREYPRRVTPTNVLA